MEPLDPKLARLVHEGMVQAVPGHEVEDRVLRGLLARLPHGGPPGGEGSSHGGPRGGDAAPQGAARAGEGAAAVGKAAAAAGVKTWALVAVLGVTAVTAGVAFGGRSKVAAGDHARDGSAASTRAEPETEARTAGSSATKTETKTETKPETKPVSTQRDPAAERSPAPSKRDRDRARVAPRASISPEAGDSTDDLAAEIQQIAAADRALARGELQRALELAREHAAGHPHGQLVLERTAIELGARCQLGAPGAAEAATAFLREHTNTPAAAKVRTRCTASKKSSEQ